MNQVFESRHPLVRHKLTHLRQTKTGVRRFKELVCELTTLLAYEALADLALTETEVTTPLDQAAGHVLADRVGLVPILRAGLGMVDPVWNLIPDAQVGHIGLYRDETSLQPVEYYSKLPQASQVDLCLLLDPMLATGGSAVMAEEGLKDLGAQQVRLLSIVAAPEGVQHLTEQVPDAIIYTAALDRELNDRKYILPGLGDFGDRLYGT